MSAESPDDRAQEAYRNAMAEMDAAEQHLHAAIELIDKINPQ